MKRSRKENYNSLIVKEWSIENPILYNTKLSKIVGSVNGGLLMSQLLYWWDKGMKKEWIFKEIKEFEEETFLSEHQQRTAIRKWEKLGVLEVRLKGIPPKRHFKIDLRKLFELAGEKYPENGETDD